MTEMRSACGSLALNLVLSAVIMYFVMFTMIVRAASFYHNLNMFYMMLMMVAPMASLMLLTMGSMYQNRRLNRALHLGFALLFFCAFFAMRQQWLIGDVQFVRSMISHHSGAILMGEQAKLSDPELIRLCQDIVQAQREEIRTLADALQRL